MTHAAIPWTNDGPDEFGDYTFTGPENALAIAVVVQNLRDPKVTKDTAKFLGIAVNSHDDMLEALESLYRETVDALSMFDNNPSDKLEDNEALKQARAAIAKAKS